VSGSSPAQLRQSRQVCAPGEHYLEKHVPASPESFLFGTSSGGYLARSNWNQTFRRAAEAIGLPSVRPHELRHTGATLAAASGATTKALMRRLGHSSPAAALLYQHAADDRDAGIARARRHAGCAHQAAGRQRATGENERRLVR
jgi:integrase